MGCDALKPRSAVDWAEAERWGGSEPPVRDGVRDSGGLSPRYQSLGSVLVGKLHRNCGGGYSRSRKQR